STPDAPRPRADAGGSRPGGAPPRGGPDTPGGSRSPGAPGGRSGGPSSSEVPSPRTPGGSTPNTPGRGPDTNGPSTTKTPDGASPGSPKPDGSSPGSPKKPDGTSPDTTKKPDSGSPDSTKKPDGTPPDSTKKPDGDSPESTKKPDADGAPDKSKDGPDSQSDPNSPDAGDKPNDPDADNPEKGTPEYDQKIDDGVNNSHRTDAGMSGHTDPNMQDLANKVPNDGKHFTVDAHMGPDGRIQIGGRSYSPDELADVLRRSGWDGKSPIRLLSCDSGDFASDLAKKLDVDVTAPSGKAWSDGNGNVFASSTAPDGGPTWPPDGGWDTHHPDGSNSPASDDAFHPSRDGADPGERPEDAEARGDDNEQINPDSPHYQNWKHFQSEVPPGAPGFQTVGRVYDSPNSRNYEPLSSGTKDPATNKGPDPYNRAALAEIRRRIDNGDPDFAEPTVLTLAHHLEVKFAMRMNSGDEATIIIDRPPCGSELPRSPSCHEYLPKLLPQGSKLTVIDHDGTIRRYEGEA
ncbi:DddA-like double-stranded DNA deaminase toxin, partial [Saccharopolyspora elongata]